LWTNPATGAVETIPRHTYDAAVARQRQSEPRETLEDVKKSLRRSGKLRANG